jgi:hypothetical protein
MEHTGISLGWNCHSASHGVKIGLRATKDTAYNTCPFDEAFTNYDGIIACIRDDFKHFMELELIDIPDDSEFLSNETHIYNRQYKFIFNHESPNYWYKQHWSGGKGHFIDNDYALFKERYNRRITNFRNYLSSGNHINFIITKQNPNLDALNQVLLEKYPKLSYRIHRLDLSGPTSDYDTYIKRMGYERIGDNY